MDTCIIDSIAALIVPMAALLAMISIASGVSYMIDVLLGYREPICRKKKSPRKAATSRGQAMQKMHRPIKDSLIIAQPNGDVKVSWVWYTR